MRKKSTHNSLGISAHKTIPSLILVIIVQRIDIKNIISLGLSPVIKIYS